MACSDVRRIEVARMKRIKHAVLLRMMALVVGLVVADVFSVAVAAQDPPSRPKSSNPDVFWDAPVKITRPKKSARRAPSKPPPLSNPNNGVLIIETSPEDAEIAIDGKPVGKANDGGFRIELGGGKQYRVTIAAGPNYLPLKKVVAITAKQSFVISAELVAKF